MKIQACFFATLFAFSAHVSVEGTWSCTYRITNSITNIVTGKNLGRQKLILDRQLSFYPNGTYEEIAAGLPVIGEGIWSKNGRKVVFKQGPANMAYNAEYGCALAGSTCKVLSVFSRATGKERRDSLVYKGQYKARLTMLTNGLMLRSVVDGNFACSR